MGSNQGYSNPDALVETDWLEEHLNDPNITVIEVDEDTTAYEKGHIPGAVAWNWSTDLHAQVGRDFVNQEQLSRLLNHSGVGEDTTVILYGGNNNWFAAYGYWLARYLGYGSVKLLNGGRKKWELESRELTMKVPTYTATDCSVEAQVVGDFRALREGVLSKLGGQAARPRSGI